jgi:hypothetical protein
MTFEEIVALHPVPPSPSREALMSCAEECLDCAASCTACADASLSEPDLQELTRVIRVCLDCADVCEATGRIAIRQTAPDVGLIRSVVEGCAAACLTYVPKSVSAMRSITSIVCAEVCRRCKDACDAVLGVL